MAKILAFLFVLASLQTSWSQNVESFGVYGGLNIPLTLDQGLRNDLRYYGQVTFRGTPVGINYGYDLVGFGFLISPSYVSIGQKYSIQNTVGGEVGERNIQMNYISVPAALKIHVNDLAFFKLSVIAAVNFNFLIKGQEILTFTNSKLRFPRGVSVPEEPGYEVTFDGVFVPDVKDQIYVDTDQYNFFQLFASVGLHSDFDLSDDWSLNFDGRANFGIFDPRKKAYTDQLKTKNGPNDIAGNPGAPDLYGQRREVYLSANIGFSRIIQIKKKFTARRTNQPLTNKPLNNRQRRRGR